MATLIAAVTHQQLLAQAVDSLKGNGTLVGPDTSESNLSGLRYLELQNVTFVLENPRARLVHAPHFDSPRAAMRALWLISGSSRIDGLQVLFPAITQFTDDGASLTGSAVGNRIIGDQQSTGGKPQIHGILDRLRFSPNTRRATVTQYLPVDAVRRSVDIPCLLSLSWSIRSGRLCCTSVMRANNLVRLLSYNVYEYTLLTECLARELGVDVGRHHHHVISLHAYEPDYSELSTISERIQAADPPAPMVSMPQSDVSPFDSARTAHDALLALVDTTDGAMAAQIVNRTRDALDSYWYGMFELVLRAGIEASRFRFRWSLA